MLGRFRQHSIDGTLDVDVDAIAIVRGQRGLDTGELRERTQGNLFGENDLEVTARFCFEVVDRLYRHQSAVADDPDPVGGPFHLGQDVR